MTRIVMTEADNANSHLLASTLIGDGYEVRMNRIVVAVDDNAMRSLLVSALFKHGYAVLAIGNEDDLHKYFADIPSTPEEAKRSSFDVVLLDMCAPGKTILDIASSIREVADRIPIVMITSFGENKIRGEIMERDGIAIVDKPFDMEQLVGFLDEYFPAFSVRQTAKAKRLSNRRRKDNLNRTSR